MCKICRFFITISEIYLALTARVLADTSHHRGPDDVGIWADPETDVAMGHRRLSIIDVSLAGAQPMKSPCGRYVIAFNGKIYNHLALREDLETIGVEHLHRKGLWIPKRCSRRPHTGAFEKPCSASMVCFLALWDRHAHQLHLARNRMGEKPLYLARLPEGWAFGSELKALLLLYQASRRAYVVTSLQTTFRTATCLTRSASFRTRVKCRLGITS